ESGAGATIGDVLSYKRYRKKHCWAHAPAALQYDDIQAVAPADYAGGAGRVYPNEWCDIASQSR
ncbi:MAG: hypothetical protein KDD77_01800, partial [Caldilineaceae bacterium]|nr:hypothetical protein [Caldilineaceae bacterium]